MKKSKLVLMIALSFSFISTGALAKGLSCQGAAEKAATKMMDEVNTEGLTDENDKPRALADAEKATVSQSYESDEEGTETNKSTGIFVIEMGVMEECLDGAIVKTKKVINEKGRESCEIISVDAFGDRDCG